MKKTKNKKHGLKVPTDDAFRRTTSLRRLGNTPSAPILTTASCQHNDSAFTEISAAAAEAAAVIFDGLTSPPSHVPPLLFSPVYMCRFFTRLTVAVTPPKIAPVVAVVVAPTVVRPASASASAAAAAAPSPTPDTTRALCAFVPRAAASPAAGAAPGTTPDDATSAENIVADNDTAGDGKCPGVKWAQEGEVEGAGAIAPGAQDSDDNGAAEVLPSNGIGANDSDERGKDVCRVSGRADVGIDAGIDNAALTFVSILSTVIVELLLVSAAALGASPATAVAGATLTARSIGVVCTRSDCFCGDDSCVPSLRSLSSSFAFPFSLFLSLSSSVAESGLPRQEGVDIPSDAIFVCCGYTTVYGHMLGFRSCMMPIGSRGEGGRRGCSRSFEREKEGRTVQGGIRRE